MGMTNEQLLQSITTVIVDRFDMLDGRIERLEQLFFLFFLFLLLFHKVTF